MTAFGWISLATVVVVLVGVALSVIAMARHKPWLAVPSAVAILVIIFCSAQITGLADDASPLAPVVIASIVAASVVAGSPLVALILQLATNDRSRPGVHGGILVASLDEKLPAKEVLRGGATVGYLERVALIGSVLAGQAAAVAVIVAIKGLGRFSELESAEARERFIIGTLASLIWAGGCAAAASLWV